ncbi:MAG: cobalt-precorrin 5A hydrolase [Atopobiaceae bacterium]|nr:cobalt-precorrin 5A hydrolase [Atopobiaceae bacterium]MBR1829373.1 cobalt-precorrin 5A hydrolase [Atopobiaceae bacterium]
MRVEIVAFTSRGMTLAKSIASALRGQKHDVQVSGPSRLAEEHGAQAYESLSLWTERAFAAADALIFVSACGIAVRSIAPFVRDKMEDPAVVAIDERARFAVSLLSGHVGGANALARVVAQSCGAEPVITTATDVNGIFSVDEWAARQGLVLCDRDEAKAVSAGLLAGATVGIRSDWPLDGTLPEGLVWDEDGMCEHGISVSLGLGIRPFAHTLRLVPRVVTVGMGCRRGTPAEVLASSLEKCLMRANVAREAIRELATIDIKADEEGLRTLADWLDVPLKTFTASELASVEGDFSASQFVFQTVGVDNVCERAACAGGGSLIVGKRTFDGVTVALACRDVRLSFDETGPMVSRGGQP